MAWMPPLSAPGVIDVMLSTNRCVATSVSFTAMSRPTETRRSPLLFHTVSSTQSSWASLNKTCSPLFTSKARTVESGKPTATRVPSGDQLTPYSVSKPTGIEIDNFRLSTFQI